PVIIYPSPKFLKEGRGEENFFGEVSSPQKRWSNLMRGKLFEKRFPPHPLQKLSNCYYLPKFEVLERGARGGKLLLRSFLPAGTMVIAYAGETFREKVSPAPLSKAFKPVITYPSQKFLKEGFGEEYFFQEVSSPQKNKTKTLSQNP
ncbi:MAG: hypothetical protein ACI3XQ_01205, partial [Eubacteriales bacterium]